MKKYTIATVMLAVTCLPADAGKREDLAYYKGWQKLGYYRGFASQYEAQCPGLIKTGAINPGVPRTGAPQDWTPNDNRYDTSDRYQARGNKKGTADAKRLLKKSGAKVYCAKLLADLGPNGKVQAGNFRQAPQLKADQAHVTLGGVSTGDSMKAVAAALGKQSRCIPHETRRSEGDPIEYCYVQDGDLDRGDTEETTAAFTPDGKIYELRRKIVPPKAVTDAEALDQAVQRFARFGKPRAVDSLRRLWNIKRGTTLSARIYQQRRRNSPDGPWYNYGPRQLIISWESKALMEANRQRYLTDKDRIAAEREKARRKKSSKTKLKF